MAAKKVFGSAEASNLVTELRRSFDDGVTRGYEWRVTQLKKLMIICDNHEPEIVAALRDDLGKPELESSVYEVRILFSLFMISLSLRLFFFKEFFRIDCDWSILNLNL